MVMVNQPAPGATDVRPGRVQGMRLNDEATWNAQHNARQPPDILPAFRYAALRCLGRRGMARAISAGCFSLSTGLKKEEGLLRKRGGTA